MFTPYCVVYITSPKGKKARQVAESLLKNHLVACVNIVPSVQSLYWWKGKIVREGEAMLVIKTRKSHLSKIKKVVTRVHPYSVPEIIALPIVDGHKPYLDWIRKETKG